MGIPGVNTLGFAAKGLQDQENILTNQGFQQQGLDIQKQEQQFKQQEAEKARIQKNLEVGVGALSDMMKRAKTPEQKQAALQLADTLKNAYGELDPSNIAMIDRALQTPTLEESARESGQLSGIQAVEQQRVKAGSGLFGDPNADLKRKEFELKEKKFGLDVAKFEESLKDGGLDSEEIFTRSKKLRTEFISLSKDFITQRDGFARVAAAAEDPSAAGDLALIFNFMKIQDPGSVVRESEFRTAADAGALTDRVAQKAYDQIVSGRRLADNQRKDFVERSRTLFGTAQKQHRKRVSEFTGLAERANLDPQNIAIDLRLAEEQAQGVDTSLTEGQTATNPTTGEKIIFRNGQWQPL